LPGGILGAPIVFTKDIKLKAKTSVVIVVSDSGVHGAVVQGAEGSFAPLIADMVYHQLPFYSEFDYDRTKTLLMHAIKIICRKLEKSMGGVLPQQVDVIFSAPWSVSEIHTTTYRKENDFLFSDQLAASLVASSLRENIQNNVETNSEKNPHNGVIEHLVMHVQLNGYYAHNPIDKKAKEAEITTLFSHTDTDFLTNIRKEIERYYPNVSSEFHSLTRTRMMAWRTLFPYLSDYLIIDVRGEITEIELVGRNSIDAIHSFPIGLHSITRMLSKRLARPAQEVLSMLHMHSRSHIGEHNEIRIQKSLAHATSQWMTSLRGSLQDLGSKRVLPKDIFLLAPPVIRRELFTTLRDELFSEYIPTHTVPIVHMIQETHSLGLVQYGHPGRRNFDIDLGVLSRELTSQN
jgi:hypothetical protein